MIHQGQVDLVRIIVRLRVRLGLRFRLRVRVRPTPRGPRASPAPLRTHRSFRTCAGGGGNDRSIAARFAQCGAGHAVGAALRLPLTCTASTPAGFDRSAQTAAMRVLSAPPRSRSRTRPRTCRWPGSPWHTAPCHTAACSAPRRMRKTAPPLPPAGLGQGEDSRVSVGVRGG